MIFRRWMIFFLVALSTACLSADIEKHLKSVPNKSSRHAIRNIDFIYMINLDQRPEKWKRATDQLAAFWIYPCRFSAVNGWNLSLDAINDVGVKFSSGMEGGFMATSYHVNGNFEQSHEIIQNYGQTYFGHCTARGTIGCWLSHVSILKDALDSGFETIWVMEDDIMLVQDPRMVSDLVERLDHLIGKGNWDILFTDRDIRSADNYYVPAYGAAKRPDYGFANDFSMKTEINSEFRRVGARFGTHSMLIRRSGMEKLWNFFKEHHMFLPIDMDLIYPAGIKLYTVLHDVVTNMPNAPSDNGGANY